MSKKTNEGKIIARYITRFMNEFVPTHKSGSRKTRESYRITLRLYLKFLENEKNVRIDSLSSQCLNKATIEEWIVWLRTQRGCGLSSCRNRLSLFRTFLQYLYDKDPAFGSLYYDSKEIKVEKGPKVKVKGLSRDAVKTLLSLPDLTTRAGRRDLALMEVMYVTAARINEVLSMKISDLHLDDPKPCIIYHGKGNKVRTLYVLSHTVALLKKYIKAYHKEKPDPDEYVFYSVIGGTHIMLSQRAVDKRLKMYAEKGNKICPDIPLNLHAHQFRHARASHWLEDGINVVQISFLLGHAQLETTMRYLDVTIEEVKAAMSVVDKDEEPAVKKWKEDNPSLADYCGV